MCLGAVSPFVLITGLPTLPDAFSMVLSAIFVFDVSGFNRGLYFFCVGMWRGKQNYVYTHQKCFIENERRKKHVIIWRRVFVLFWFGFLFIRGWMNDFILPLTHVIHHDALCAFFSI